VTKQRSQYLTESEREALAQGLTRMGFDPTTVAQMVIVAAHMPAALAVAPKGRKS
jgi:hypothetical protein